MERKKWVCIMCKQEKELITDDGCCSECSDQRQIEWEWKYSCID